MTPVRESQVEDLVTVFSQRLNLHAGDTVKQTPELPVPRHSRCTKVDQELFKAATGLSIYSINKAIIRGFCNCYRIFGLLVPGCRGTERGMR